MCNKKNKIKNKKIFYKLTDGRLLQSKVMIINITFFLSGF